MPRPEPEPSAERTRPRASPAALQGEGRPGPGFRKTQACPNARLQSWGHTCHTASSQRQVALHLGPLTDSRRQQTAEPAGGRGAPQPEPPHSAPAPASPALVRPAPPRSCTARTRSARCRRRHSLFQTCLLSSQRREFADARGAVGWGVTRTGSNPPGYSSCDPGHKLGEAQRSRVPGSSAILGTPFLAKDPRF